MKILTAIQFIAALLLIACVLLQQRGTGLGSAFGGDGGNAFRTIRGIERSLVIATVVLAVIFFGTAIAQIVL